MADSRDTNFNLTSSRETRNTPFEHRAMISDQLRHQADDASHAVEPVHATESTAKSALREVLEWIGLVGGALFVALIVKTFIIQAFYIPSASMHDTLVEGDHVIVNKLSYAFSGPKRGDIIVFERPPNDNDSTINDLIKRVIALPNESVSCNNQRIHIDGRPLDETNYVVGVACSADLPPHTLGENEFWVMGDNRGDSTDSRVFGPISGDLIVGRAFVKVWPLSNFGFL